jgi:futalosine hydrolase
MPKGTAIGLLSAVDFEAALLIKQMKGRKGSGPFTAGAVEGSPVVHGTSGMGCANAARGATLLIEKFSPALVVLFGIGGAYPSTGLRPGDLAAAQSEVYADLGVPWTGGFSHARQPASTH